MIQSGDGSEPRSSENLELRCADVFFSSTAQMVPKSMPTVGQLVFAQRLEYVCTSKYVFHSNCSIPLYSSV